MKEHPDKHIRAAIDYARARGGFLLLVGKARTASDGSGAVRPIIANT